MHRFLLILICCGLGCPVYAQETSPQFVSSKATLSPELQQKMQESTWREGCPVPLEDLRIMTLSHYTMDGSITRGQIIVHNDVTRDIKRIFRAAFEAKFPIYKMRPVHEYDGSDDRSVEDNNTSAFNCRSITGKKGVFSKHSYGRAIDINPLLNPYVKGKTIIPREGKPYLNRKKTVPGMLLPKSSVTQDFLKKGWEWGGDWTSLKDYQHFEKNPK